MKRTGFAMMVVLLFVIATAGCTGESGSDSAAAPQSTTEIVAYLNDAAITGQEIDETIVGDLTKLRQQEYDLRRRALDQLIAKRLMEAEAANRGIEMNDLAQQEIQQKVSVPTEEEVRKFYEDNKGRMQNRTLEQVAGNIQNFLLRQRAQSRENEYIDALKAKAAIRILLDVPRADVEVPAGEPAKGPEDAPITIVEFSDYQCPYCRNAEAAVEQLLAEYPGKIRFVYRDYPLGFHPRAIPAARAARCAGDQGKYWEYHDGLFDKFNELDDDALTKRAEEVGLDMAAFQTCFSSDRHADAVTSSFEAGAGLGVTGTPTFFINGRMLVGAQPYEELKKVVDDELTRVGEASDAGESQAQVGG